MNSPQERPERRWTIFQPAFQTAPVITDMGGDPPLLTGHSVEVMPVSDHEADIQARDRQVDELKARVTLGFDLLETSVTRAEKAESERETFANEADRLAEIQRERVAELNAELNAEQEGRLKAENALAEDRKALGERLLGEEAVEAAAKARWEYTRHPRNDKPWDEMEEPTDRSYELPKAREMLRAAWNEATGHGFPLPEPKQSRCGTCGSDDPGVCLNTKLPQMKPGPLQPPSIGLPRIPTADGGWRPACPDPFHAINLPFSLPDDQPNQSDSSQEAQTEDEEDREIERILAFFESEANAADELSAQHPAGSEQSVRYKAERDTYRYVLKALRPTQPVRGDEEK